jgi:hypothetical protein
VKDRIGNVLAAGDKVLVELPVSSIIGFVAELQEPGKVALRAPDRVPHGYVTPGRVLVSCVVALPVDGEFGAVAQLVKVYDAAKEGTQEPFDASKTMYPSRREN